MLAVSSIHEGETSWLRNSSRSNGIQLMTKLIEGLTRAVSDKVALFVSVHADIYAISVLAPLCVCARACGLVALA